MKKLMKHANYIVGMFFAPLAFQHGNRKMRAVRIADSPFRENIFEKKANVNRIIFKV